ncbi:KH domain-containing protein [Aphelenchoides avenae]|nr:KH domain-containing protein [Aphelenchus avenae]
MNTTSERANNTIPNHSTANHQQYFAHPPTQIHHQRVASGQGEQRMSTEQVLNLIEQINNSVSAGDFSSQLAHKIFLLCQQLKSSGQHLEQTHKRELNRVFVALRQACCRDNGQLGTPCRLKMMELIELRAMGWRSNLAHTQYYLNRPEQSANANASASSYVTSQHVSEASMGTSMYAQLPMNPYSHHQFINPPPNQPLFMSSDISASTSTVAAQPMQAAPGYFLIPATGGWAPQATAVLPQHPGAMGILGPAPAQATMRAMPTPAMVPDVDWGNRQAAIAAVSAYLAGGPNSSVPGGKGPLAAANRVQNNKSSKSLQFREEMTIRNSDSGKIMGVKGRRVAVIEELSKTVISFQKVDAKSKERVLTITGSSQDTIQYARKLIEDTIKRNVSPSRVESNGGETEDDEDEEESAGAGISIETAQDGTLKLCCDDPQMLQAAQAALTEYLNRAQRGTRMTAEERELRKERRKSMPLQSASAQAPEAPPATMKETRLAFTGSTPNLAAAELNATGEGSKRDASNVAATTSASAVLTQAPAVRYDRHTLLDLRAKAADSAFSAETVNRAREVMPEILRNETQ